MFCNDYWTLLLKHNDGSYVAKFKVKYFDNKWRYQKSVAFCYGPSFWEALCIVWCILLKFWKRRYVLSKNNIWPTFLKVIHPRSKPVIHIKQFVPANFHTKLHTDSFKNERVNAIWNFPKFGVYKVMWSRS